MANGRAIHVPGDWARVKNGGATAVKEVEIQGAQLLAMQLQLIGARCTT